MIAHVHTLLTLRAIDSNTHIFNDINILGLLMSVKTRRLFSRYFFAFKELAEMKFLRKRKKEKVNEIKEKDIGDLSQVMIIISGLAVAGIVVTGAIAGVSLTKGEESARCINDFSAFDSGANKSDCSIAASDNGGTLSPGGNENVTPGTPIEKDESSPTSEECFKVASVPGGTSITKYLIDEKPEECGKFVIIPNELNGAPVVTIGNSAFNRINYKDFSVNEKHKINSVVIPSTVKTIGYMAFVYNNLESVNIPDSVTTLEDNAFKNNELSSVKISNSLESLGQFSFAENNLTSVNIPDSVKHIKAGVFASNQLTSVNIPDSIKRIDGSAFSKNKLTSFNIPDSVEHIGTGAFENNQLINVNIPDSVEEIAGNAFMNNQLTYVKIPDSVTTIGRRAFYNNQLTSVDISNSLTIIDAGVFQNNQLTSVTVPKSVEMIGQNAFTDNHNLKEVILPKGTKISGSPIPRGAKIIYY